MKNFSIILLFCVLYACGQTQSSNLQKIGHVIPNNRSTDKKIVLGNCEGCEAVYEHPENITWTATMPDYEAGKGQKLHISGAIYEADGKTPASDVIIYVYHTNEEGLYVNKNKATNWEKRHGYLRAWAKTNAQGKYEFKTHRPASYPKSKIPAHIHATISEPDKGAYWIDEFVFDDDKFIDEKYRQEEHKRGGSGIVKVVEKQGIGEVKRDIILGLNVAEYPRKSAAKSVSMHQNILQINPNESVIRWTGTKFGGLGKHEGIIKVQKGTIKVSENQITDGEFTIEMNTLEVTDIPESDPIPRNKLRHHLLEKDFFWAEQYPTAHFKIRKTTPKKEWTHFYTIQGDLTIRGVTKSIEFYAKIPTISSNKVKDFAKISFNRQDFGVAFRGSKLTHDLVDDLITLNPEFVTE
jgi:protocatechuate 3,4-dioxygenase beta subunit